MSNEEKQKIRELLARFIEDFNHLEMEKVASHFAADATMFPRVVMSPEGTEDIVLTDWQREEGPAPFQSMEAFAAELRGESSGPRYMNLDPEDLRIQLFDNAALVTFHLKDSQRLARRTIVLVRRDGEWKIVHLHASNVQSA